MRVARATTLRTYKVYATAATTRNRAAKPTKSMAKKRHITTEDDIAYIKEHYDTMSAQEIAEARGMSKTTVSYIAHDLGVKKSREWIAERARLRALDPNHGGAQTRFKKGNIPHTKGRRVEEWMSPEGQANSAKTRFKKGSRPVNYRPVGSERINVEGYVEVKVAEGKPWRHKQRVVWEEAHGKLPSDVVVSFKDGNKQNCELDNLYLATKADKLREVSVNNYPDDVREVIHMRAVLRRHINTQKRKINGK